MFDLFKHKLNFFFILNVKIFIINSSLMVFFIECLFFFHENQITIRTSRDMIISTFLQC